MKRWKLGLTFTAVFLAGMIAGGLTILRIIPPFGGVPDAGSMTAHLMRRLNHDLPLTPEQTAKIQPIIARTTEQTLASHREFTSRIEAIIDASDSEIESLLDPTQKARFESNASETSASAHPAIG